MQLAQIIKLPGTDAEGKPTVIELQGPTQMADRFSDIGDVVGKLVPIMLSIAGLILFIMLIWGGYDFLFSGGDPGKVEAGRTRIMNAIIGFVIVFVAYFLVQLLGFIFGFSLF
ncbi:MAG: hypothetical protein UU81_C0013G0004 [Microgenomates group bacterium GW2011_GWC1_41_8]|uniref:Uncharacterized protein n=2 Tax=Candidatus Roizmaniibacteriota TaxID=1752723 RepID=A0A0G0TCB1_9BACT|nr:MAG: hypothetical protein UT85_C0005G0003 [Candidatus Levybacteria bacterium GW2011_GWA2_40_16]KKR72466.1 MAG: hypothetical protein UU14_C0005G0034 [Candidatus Roizmanbacteria bacterium GW2011_GWB1_40_7]KKR94802.1 MAG: hypothetical protein UU41_C0003G0021 [Candidatus Roizmanbacteria bacterium GW2011_GWA1_41_13]KKS24080.1 MAG: hypothetical protein UU81_C0013G0004 [Microgenomates group bacterium GW2011_GWC1_41_8]OGK47686.1 MAG: hypothetical protein A3A55_01550 [Candidatus Roizmanbacteria bacte